MPTPRKNPLPAPQPIFYVEEDIPAVLRVSADTISALERAGRFPRKRQISPGRSGYLAAEVHAWAAATPVSEILPPANCGGRGA